jgi:beta-glucuronidase
MMFPLRSVVSALLMSFMLTAALPRGASAQPPVPAAIPLASGWELAPDPGDVGAARHWESPTPSAPATASAPWKPAAVPGVFDPRPLKSLFGGTVGWYRVTFTAPSTPGFDWAASFEQVRRVARIWLNGAPLATHTDPYVPFTVPLRGLRPGEPNTLVLRVDNRKAREPREGWWNWGGITRPVSLVPLGQVALRDLGVVPLVRCAGPDDCRANVLLDGEVTNRTKGSVQPTLKVRLVAPGSGQITEHTVAVRSLLPGETALVRRTLTVAGRPQLWSPDAPRLYEASVETFLGAAPQQVDRLRIGLRSVAVRHGMLFLNGRELNLRGASIQEDVAGHGPALTDADMDAIVAQLKSLHANVTRAHYLLNQRLLDKFDEAGILVWSQAPVYHRDRLLESRARRAFELRTLRGTVLGARNHPSVITHSVANELSVTPDTVPGTRAYLDSARRIVAQLDPALPASVDLLSYPGFPRQRTYARYDLFGVNSYFGWYPGKPAHPTGRLDDLGPYLVRLRGLYPNQAMVLTEFGAESTMNGPPHEKETYAFQSAYIRRVLGIVERLPFMNGSIYWTLREFAVKPDWDGGAKRDVPRDSIHNKGLITYSGRLKPAWRVAEVDFAATPMYRGAALAAAAGAGGASLGAAELAVLGVIALFVLALLALCAWAVAGIMAPEPRERRLPAFADAATPGATATPARVVARP